MEEAAAYCGVARSTFEELAGKLPYGGKDTLRLYHCDVLDRFINGEITGISFVKKPKAPRRRPRNYGHGAAENYLVDPVTGQVYGPR